MEKIFEFKKNMTKVKWKNILKEARIMKFPQDFTIKKEARIVKLN